MSFRIIGNKVTLTHEQLERIHNLYDVYEDEHSFYLDKCYDMLLKDMACTEMYRKVLSRRGYLKMMAERYREIYHLGYIPEWTELEHNDVKFILYNK